MSRPLRSLILVRAGDRSLHEEWLEPAPARRFDLAVSYYGSTPGRWAERADFHSAQKGPKWPCVADWIDRNWASISSYDYVAIPDDDLSCDASVWTRTFDLMAEHGLDLAQPSFGRDSNWVHPITAQHPGSSVRITNFIENGLAVFSRRALEWCTPVMRLGTSGVGTDYAWATIVRHAGGRVGVIDEVSVEHVRAHHGAGGSAHQSAGSLSSVLPHPELFDELLLMGTFGIGNPYDPFVERTIPLSTPGPGSERPPVPEAGNGAAGAEAVSFVIVGSGPADEVRATVQSVLRALRAGDELLLVDATFDSHLSETLGGHLTARPGQCRTVTLPDEGLPACYDVALRSIRHPVAVLVTAGWAVGPRFRDQIRERPGAHGAVIADGAPVAVIPSGLIGDLGGMSRLSQIVTTGFGKVGTGDLLEAARHQLESHGRAAVRAQLDVIPALAANEPAAAPAAPGRVPATQARPHYCAASRTFAAEVLDVVHPGALSAILSMADLVAPGQRQQYMDLVRSRWPHLPGSLADAPRGWPPELTAAVENGPFRTTRLVHALIRRNNLDQAATLLEAKGISGGASPAEINEAVAVMKAAGRPLARLASAAPDDVAKTVVAAIAGLPLPQALESLSQWWELDPGNRHVIAAIQTLAPLLPVEAAVAWSSRLDAVGGTDESPLLVIARNTGRDPHERATAVKAIVDAAQRRAVGAPR